MLGWSGQDMDLSVLLGETSSIFSSWFWQTYPSVLGFSSSGILPPVCTSFFFSLLHPASLHHTVKMDWERMKEGRPLPYESSLSYTLREEEFTRDPFHSGEFLRALKRSQKGKLVQKRQVKRVRLKTKHAIHCGQTLPQSLRGKRSVLYCTSNCSNVMEMPD